jgi:hypothetical protein
MRRPRIQILSPEDAAGALDAAEATLARWSDEAANQAHQADVLAAELAEAQSRAADDLLDAEDADDDAAAVARLADELLRRQTEQGIAVQAAERAAERLTVVRRDVLKARAGTIRTRAAGLRAVATSRQARTEQLLAELSDFEQVPYAPAPRPSALGIGGSGIAARTMTQNLLGRAKWLEDHAEFLEFTAAQGADEQVTAGTNRGLPDLIDVELAVADTAAV